MRIRKYSRGGRVTSQTRPLPRGVSVTERLGEPLSLERVRRSPPTMPTTSPARA